MTEIRYTFRDHRPNLHSDGFDESLRGHATGVGANVT